LSSSHSRTDQILRAFFALVCLLSPVSVLAVGETGAVELKIPVGTRAIAMGKTFVAVADDANSVYWNPAGLRQLGGIHVTLQHDVFIETVRFDYLSIGAMAGNDLGVGLSVMLLGTGTEPATNPGDPPIGENFMAINLAGAFRLNYQFDIGLSAKYVSKDLSGTSASTFAVDLGVLYKTPIPKLTAGLNLQNLGPGMKFVDVEDPLPLNLKVGAAYKMFEDDFTAALDFNFPSDNDISVSLGGEYWYQDLLVGRFGYHFQGEIDKNEYGIGGKAGIFLGGGVKIKAFNTFIGLDYAWADTGFFGANHHFALDVYL
jgi:long-subunit fatty acid transport protein